MAGTGSRPTKLRFTHRQTKCINLQCKAESSAATTHETSCTPNFAAEHAEYNSDRRNKTTQTSRHTTFDSSCIDRTCASKQNCRSEFRAQTYCRVERTRQYIEFCKLPIDAYVATRPERSSNSVNVTKTLGRPAMVVRWEICTFQMMPTEKDRIYQSPFEKKICDLPNRFSVVPAHAKKQLRGCENAQLAHAEKPSHNISGGLAYQKQAEAPLNLTITMHVDRTMQSQQNHLQGDANFISKASGGRGTMQSQHDHLQDRTRKNPITSLIAALSTRSTSSRLMRSKKRRELRSLGSSTHPIGILPTDS